MATFLEIVAIATVCFVVIFTPATIFISRLPARKTKIPVGLGLASH